MSFRPFSGLWMNMPNPLVHLELHTGDLSRARAVYTALCGWDAETIDAGCPRPNLALDVGAQPGGEAGL
jgi:predicted enzyme related to lactoylglutathione lyase